MTPPETDAEAAAEAELPAPLTQEQLAAVSRVMDRLGCRPSRLRRTIGGPRRSWCRAHDWQWWGSHGCPVAVDIVTHDLTTTPAVDVAALQAAVDLWTASARAYLQVATWPNQQDAAEYAAKAGIAQAAAADVTDILAGRTPPAGRWVHGLERRVRP